MIKVFHDYAPVASTQEELESYIWTSLTSYQTIFHTSSYSCPWWETPTGGFEDH